MADSQDDIRYSFEGDTSSLRQATQQAISLLNRFDRVIKATAAKDTFKASRTSATNFQRAVGGLTRQFTSLSKSLNVAGSSIDASIPNGAEVVKGAIKDLADVMEYLNDVSSIASDDLKLLTDTLRGAKASLDPVAARAQLLASSLKPLSQTQPASQIRATGKAAQTTSKQLNAAAQSGYRVQQAYQASGKSAAESASVFLRVGRASGQIGAVQAAIQRARVEMYMFGAQTKKSWDQFSKHLDPVTSKLQSFKDRASKSLGHVKSVLSQVSSAFRRNSEEADESDDSFEQLQSRSNKLGKSLQNLHRHTHKSHKGFRMLERAARSFTSVVRSLIGLQLSSWLVSAAKQSIDYAENLNLFRVAMGEAVDVGNEFIAQMAEIYGMDPSNLMRYAGNFYQLSDAIDMPSETAAKLSLSLVKATNDISSLFNVPIEKVFDDLSSGMQGMSRAVRKYGMDIRATTIQQTALSLGITESVETMSEANRQGLRFITMMKQATNASGDFARTIESPANQLKVFKEQITQLGRAIGDLFVTPLRNAIQHINGFVMALRMVINFVGSILGWVRDDTDGITDVTEDVAESVEHIGAAAGSAAKELKAMLAPFDELNVLSKPDASAGIGGGSSVSDILDPAIAAEIENMELQLEQIRMKSVEVRDALLEFFGFETENGVILDWDASEFEENLINKFPQWTKTIQAVFSNWSSIMGAFGSLFNALAGIAQTAWTKVTGFFGKFINDDSVSSYIDGLAESIESFATYLNNNQNTIANFAITLGSLLLAFKAFSAIGTWIAPILVFVATCSNALGSFAAVIGWVAATVAVLTTLSLASTNLASAFSGLGTSVGTGLLTIFEAFRTSLQGIWADMQTLWAGSILPMLEGLGDAIAPVIQTVSALWSNLSDIVASTFGTVERIWVNTLSPVLAAFFEAIQKLAGIFKTLWSEYVGPVVEHIGSGISTLWSTTLSPIFESVLTIIGQVIEIVLLLWNNALAPLTNWLLDVFAPIVSNVFKVVWDVVQNSLGGIGQILNGLLTILSGIIDYVVGVFTGDWEKAWQGVVTAFQGVWDVISGVVKLALNAVIAVINTALGAISGAINSIIRAINKISFKAPDWVPGLGGKTLGFNIKQIGTWKIPYLENGGVVTSPTLAMVGEGRHDEAVIPLGNSPQMQELINKIADATKHRGGTEPIQVNVYIGNEQVAEYMHNATRRSQLQTNGGI